MTETELVKAKKEAFLLSEKLRKMYYGLLNTDRVRTAHELIVEYDINQKIYSELRDMGFIVKRHINGEAKPLYKWDRNVLPGLDLAMRILHIYPISDEKLKRNSSILTLKPKTMTIKLDTKNDWVIPETRGRHTLKGDFRVNVNNAYFYLDYRFLKTNFPLIDLNKVKAGFMLYENDHRGFIVINPNEGSKCYDFRIDGDSPHPNPKLSNRGLTDKFMRVFKLKKHDVIAFTLSFWQEKEGMWFFEIHKEGIEDLFFDDKKNTNSLTVHNAIYEDGLRSRQIKIPSK